jgi:LuxR family maltose regulon positive regulatory protein
MVEVLSLQLPEMTDYFIGAAILNRFCAPVLEAMHLKGAGAEKKPAAITAEQFIRWAIEANLFIVALDGQGRWFRLHHFFQDFLKSLLRKRRTADQIAGLHRKASEWFAENGLIEEAIRHALVAEDNEVAVRLVVEHRYDLMNNARYHILNNWLELLPREIVNEAPLLVTTKAITAWVNGQRDDVEKFTEQAKRLVDTLSPESSEYSILQGEIITLHNLIGALYNRPAKSWIDPIKALELLPKEALFFRILAIAEMAFRHQMKGDLNQGVKLLKEELKTADLPVSIQARGWFYLCVVSYLDCNTSGTLLSGLNSIKLAEKHRLAHTRGLAKYFVGASYYLRNELTKAKHYIKGSIDDRAFTNSIYVTQACGILGFIYLSEGSPDKAESVIGQAVDSAWEMQDNYSPAIKKALRVELLLRRGMVAEARRVSIDVDFDFLPPTWFVYVPQLTNIKLLLADGTDRSLEDARSRLVEMDQTMRSINRKCVRIDLLALLALVCREMGEEKAALAKLQAALDLAEPGGWIRNFVDLGTPMAGLLKRLIEVEPGRTHAKKILDAFRAESQADPSSSPHAKSAADSAVKVLVSPLAPRETELVSLLAAGLSNKEIAVKLHIATETVKTHLQNLYQKLDARGRLAAVHAARTLGLIPKD